MIAKQRIHATAVVSSDAQVHPSVIIGPYSVIGPNVVLGAGCELKSHVVLEGRTEFGAGNVFYPFSSLGLAPPDVKFKGEASTLKVGDNNIFREGVTIHRGTESGGLVTAIGNGNWFLPYVHIGHDCQIGSCCIFVNNTALAGHVHCGDWVNLGGFTLVAPYCKVGNYVHTSAGTQITKCVPDYLHLTSLPTRALGVNTVGMQRAGLPQDVILAMQNAYKIVYKKGVLLKSAKDTLRLSSWYTEYQAVRSFYNSLDGGQKGIVR